MMATAADPMFVDLMAELEESEGFRPHLYDDHDGRDITAEVNAICTGTPTFGIGQTFPVSFGVARATAYAALHEVWEELCQRAPVDPRALPPLVRTALADMAFNMGVPRLLGFKRMWAALYDRNFKLAAAECMDSKYGRGRLRRRAQRNADRMREAGR